MFCQKCGSELEDKALFCTECGAEIKHDENKAQGANETRSVEPISIPVDNSPQQAKSVENAPQVQKLDFQKSKKFL